MDNIYNLKLHEEFTGEGISATRVPGGWIYRFWDYSCADFYPNTIFVPYDNEFQREIKCDCSNCLCNKCCDDWEKYCKHLEEHAELNRIKAGEQYQEKWDIINSLPSEEEIAQCLIDNGLYGSTKTALDLAKAISKRIRGIKPRTKECFYFDGGCCCNEEAFPTGVPTEIGGDTCHICKFYKPLSEGKKIKFFSGFGDSFITWFRIYGKGLSFSFQPPTFSERYGCKRYLKIGKLKISWLK